jgi:hypothetical protein
VRTAVEIVRAWPGGIDRGTLDASARGRSFALAPRFARSVIFALSCGFVVSVPVSKAHAIVGSCSSLEIDAPCLPAGGSSECGGVCRSDPSGSVACLALTTLGLSASYNNNKLCGATLSNDCGLVGKMCVTGSCVDPNTSSQPIPGGAACRPTSMANRCQGTCTGVGTGACASSSSCAYGQRAAGADNCQFDTCGGAATSCIAVSAQDGATCDDGQSGTTDDTCSAGTCSDDLIFQDGFQAGDLSAWTSSSTDGGASSSSGRTERMWAPSISKESPQFASQTALYSNPFVKNHVSGVVAGAAAAVGKALARNRHEFPAVTRGRQSQFE